MRRLDGIIVEWFCTPPSLVRLTVALLLLETAGFGLPSWIDLWHIRHAASANNIFKTMGLVAGILFMALLTYLLFRQHLGRLRYLKRSPCRETLYRPAMVWVGFWLATLGLVGLCLLGLFASIWWHLLFHWSVMATLLVWIKETSEERETVLARELEHFGARVGSRSSPEGSALVISAHLWSSVLAGLISVEAVLFLSWWLFQSVAGTLVMFAFLVVLCGGFASLVLGSSVRMARSARVDIARNREQ
jgi:hypothetical protein